jgi:hypothetical protein
MYDRDPDVSSKEKPAEILRKMLSFSPDFSKVKQESARFML